jgi:hypothetical protein
VRNRFTGLCGEERIGEREGSRVAGETGHSPYMITARRR